MEKKFECKPYCKSFVPESIIFGCDDCIKKKEYKLTKEQAITILSVMGLDDKFNK